MADPVRKSKCLGCGKTRGHVPGCKFIPCKKCGTPDHLGHDVDCPNFIGAEPPPEAEQRSTRTTVDGHEAEVHHHDVDDDEGEDAYVPFPPIELIDGALDALQESVNNGDFSGAKQKQDQCEFEATVDGDAVRCPNIVVMKKVVKGHCDACDRDKKTVILKLCIPHAVNVWGGNQPSRLQTEMDFAAEAAS